MVTNHTKGWTWDEYCYPHQTQGERCLTTYSVWIDSPGEQFGAIFVNTQHTQLDDAVNVRFEVGTGLAICNLDFDQSLFIEVVAKSVSGI